MAHLVVIRPTRFSWLFESVGLRTFPLIRWTAVLIATLPPSVDGAVPAQIDRQLDQYVHRKMHEDHLVGLSLAVLRNGQLITAKGFGLANVETGTPATPKTVYKIGSVSKQFIATAIMILVKDGKVSLSDRLDRYLEDAPSAWKAITIEQLLTHTSGLRASTQQPEGDPPGYDPYSEQSNIDVIRRAYSVPLDFAPGEKWAYSNLGYFVLAQIISQASGIPWSEYIRTKVFAPVGMAETRVTSTTEIVSNRAGGYEVKNGRLQNAASWIAVRPSGAFLSTVLDMAKWDAALYADTVLSSAMRDRMWAPARLKDGSTHPYGFGWAVDQWNGHTRLHHNGGIAGFRSDLERFVDDKLTVIVMMNTTAVDPEEIALGIVRLYEPGWTSKQ